MIDPHLVHISLHFLFCFVCSFFFGGGGVTSVQFLSNSFQIKLFTEISLHSRNMQSRVSE